MKNTRTFRFLIPGAMFLAGILGSAASGVWERDGSGGGGQRATQGAAAPAGPPRRFVVNLNSGAPLTITAGNSPYGNARPDIVGPFPVKDGHATFTGTPAANGAYWEPGTFEIVKDPQCGKLAASLQSLCTLNAVADAKTHQILIQSAQPGTVPTMGLGSIIGPGRWRFDANLSKSIKITETKNLQFRMDAADVLNHPEPNAPSLNVTGTAATNFGLIVGKSNLHRQLQAQLRFSF